MLSIKAVSYIIAVIFTAHLSLATLLQEGVQSSVVDAALPWLNLGVAGSAVIVLAWFAYRLYNDNQAMHRENSQSLIDRATAAEQAAKDMTAAERMRQEWFIGQVKEVVNAHSQALVLFSNQTEESVKRMQERHADAEDRRSKRQSEDTGQLRSAVEKLGEEMAKMRSDQQQINEGLILTLEGLSNGFSQMTNKLSEQDELRRIREELDKIKRGGSGQH